MEATIKGFIGYMMGLFWDNGKENGNYYSILGYIYIYPILRPFLVA